MFKINKQLSDVMFFLFFLLLFYFNRLKQKRDAEKQTEIKTEKEIRERKITTIVFFIFLVVFPFIGTAIMFSNNTASALDPKSLLLFVCVIIFILSLIVFHKKAQGRLLLTGYVLSIFMLFFLIAAMLGQTEIIVYGGFLGVVISAAFYVISSCFFYGKDISSKNKTHTD